MKTYGEIINKVDEAIDAELDIYKESEFVRPLKYVLNGGKRVRPTILVLAARCVGKDDGNTYLAAVAEELIHIESIIHDDMIDRETTRRGRDPFHIKYGNDLSILSGDFLLGLILNIAAKLDNPRITNGISRMAMRMSEGEAMEIRLAADGSVTVEDYLKVIELKTAMAFQTAAEIGAILGGGTEKQIAALRDYGRDIGIAYQIRDDLQDWESEEKLLKLLKKESRMEDFAGRVEEMIEGYSSHARASLRELPDSDARNHLEEIVDFVAKGI